VLVDTRQERDRRRDGAVPGSLPIPRTVLEWAVDPASGCPNPAVGGFDRQLIVMCNEGFSSSLAAANLRRLGFDRATDLVGGFAAWRAAGLPVQRAQAAPGGIDGRGPAEPGEP
jgi:rhodanese-related sulfurtransferase